MHGNWGKSFFLSPGQENDFPSYWIVYGKMYWFMHIFLQNLRMVPKVYALSRSYLDFFRILWLFSIYYAQTVLFWR